MRIAQELGWTILAEVPVVAVDEELPVWPDASDPERSVSRLVTRLTVVATCASEAPIRHSTWLIHHQRQAEARTTVTLAELPESRLLVLGDLSDFVFAPGERGLHIAKDLEEAALGARTGRVREYSPLKARAELVGIIRRRLRNSEIEPGLAAELQRDADRLDFDDIDKVHAFLWDQVEKDSPEGESCIGQIFSGRFLWAIACVRSVLALSNGAEGAGA